MTLTLVIDSTISHEVAWDGDAGSLLTHAEKQVRGSAVSTLQLAAGSSVLINWRAVKTVEVRDRA